MIQFMFAKDHSRSFVKDGLSDSQCESLEDELIMIIHSNIAKVLL